MFKKICKGLLKKSCLGKLTYLKICSYQVEVLIRLIAKKNRVMQDL
jgi:hypothetical protein